MRRVALTLLTLLVFHAAGAQPAFDPVSRSAGGVWLREGGDPWCALSAAALLGPADRFGVGFAHFPSAWGLGALSASAAAAVLPAGPGAVGFTLTRFGSALYSEVEAGAAWGATAGAFSWGASVRLRRISIERYGTAWTPRVDLTASVHTTEWFLWGVRVRDVNRGPVGRSGERLGQGIAVAAAFLPRGPAGLFLQADNEEGEGVSVRAGISVALLPVAVRAGASGSFTRIHAGFDLPLGDFIAGYGVVAHPVLGWSHAFWVSTRGGR